MWGVTTAVGMFHSRWVGGRGSGSVTSTPAPERWPLSSASHRASVSTMKPRPTFRSTAPSFILARRSRLIRPRVASVPGKVMATTSAWGSRLSKSSSRWTSSAYSGQGRGLLRTPMTLAPRALHRAANSPPMSPMPSTSTVEPYTAFTAPWDCQAPRFWASR